ncbi:class I SAM-dependent methyltransferase [Bacillus spongiae]|uniref:Class I SAM-dependent methyltransferase n=1 Tax=Bacillus spongiae TaxID=2683610 RepID=A0ABU8HDW4_9BACI
MKSIESGKVTQPYIKSRDEIPNSFFDSLLFRGIQFKGKRIVDLGAGTGTLTRKIHKRGGDIVGIEPSSLINIAEQLNEKYMTTVPYRKEYAENVSLTENECDMVVAFRSWQWFERQKVLGEINRILKKNGIFIVADSTISQRTPVVEETFSLLKRYLPEGFWENNARKPHINNLPVEWFTEWTDSGFDTRDVYKKYYDVPFTIDEWCDCIRFEFESLTMEMDRLEEGLQALKEHLRNDFQMNESFLIRHSYQVVILHKLDE